MSRAKKMWMQGAVKRPGALHRKLHVPMDKKIPISKIKKAERSGELLLEKEAHLADTFRKYHG